MRAIISIDGKHYLTPTGTDIIALAEVIEKWEALDKTVSTYDANKPANWDVKDAEERTPVIELAIVPDARITRPQAEVPLPSAEASTTFKG